MVNDKFELSQKKMDAHSRLGVGKSRGHHFVPVCIIITRIKTRSFFFASDQSRLPIACLIVYAKRCFH